MSGTPTPLRARYDALVAERPKPRRRELLERLAHAEHRLEVRDDAYRRLVVDNGHRGQRAELAEACLVRIEELVALPFTQPDPGAALRANITAHLGTYKRAIEESELYHSAHLDQPIE